MIEEMTMDGAIHDDRLLRAARARFFRSSAPRPLELAT
jgi:hypothetical protein